MIPTNEMLKSIFVKDQEISALIDTGSVVSLVKESVCENFDCLVSNNVDLLLSWFVRCKVCVIGSFNTKIRIDDNYFSVTLNVVPDQTMSHDAILGIDLMERTEITINQEGMVISKPKDEGDIMNVNFICTDLDVGNKSNHVTKKITGESKNLFCHINCKKSRRLT